MKGPAACLIAALLLAGCATNDTERAAIACSNYVRDPGQPSGWRCNAWVFNTGAYGVAPWRLQQLRGPRTFSGEMK